MVKLEIKLLACLEKEDVISQLSSPEAGDRVSSLAFMVKSPHS
jgi:hypothetical protein